MSTLGRWKFVPLLVDSPQTKVNRIPVTNSAHKQTENKESPAKLLVLPGESVRILAREASMAFELGNCVGNPTKSLSLRICLCHGSHFLGGLAKRIPQLALNVPNQKVLELKWNEAGGHAHTRVSRTRSRWPSTRRPLGDSLSRSLAGLSSSRSS